MTQGSDPSLFEEYRRRHPSASDREVIRRLCERVLAEAEAEPPIAVERVASLRGIAEISERDQPWAGVLQPRGRHFVVWVRRDDGYERQRFTICHETGHTLFAGFAEAPQYRCNGETTTLEQRCDIAASELLLPYRCFVEDLSTAPFDLQAVQELAGDYEASIESTALRFVDLWPEPASLIVFRERHKLSERGREAECQPKLRVEYAHSQGGWPFIRGYKSVESDSPFGRALAGEVVSEVGDLGELVGDDVGPVEIHARRYGSNARILALVRWSSGARNGANHSS